MRLLPLALLPIVGCTSLNDPGEPPRACTEEFRTYTVQVVDAQGQPVEGLESTARVVRTGEVLAQGQEPFPPGEGHYVVATDADREAISPEGDAVLFTAAGPALEAEAAFTFYDDGCHVVKQSGPERVVATPAGD